jgi:hypothetical protein
MRSNGGVHHIPDSIQHPQIMSNCLNCNEPLEQTPGKKEKQFCNVSCRSSYWQKQKRAETKAQSFQETVVEAKKTVTLPPQPRHERPPVMPPGLTPQAQQAWLQEQRKKLQENRLK